jgi:hypothetical protein
LQSLESEMRLFIRSGSTCRVRSSFAVASLVVIAFALMPPLAQAQASGQSAPAAPAMGTPPSYCCSSVDSTSSFVVSYTISPNSHGRFSVSGGTVDSKCSIVIDSCCCTIPPSPTLLLTFTLGKAGVQMKTPVVTDALTQNGNTYTLSSGYLNRLGGALVQLYNDIDGGFDADHVIPPITANVQFADSNGKPLAGSYAKICGTVQIVFQPVATLAVPGAAAPANPAAKPGQQPGAPGAQ